MHAAVRGQHVLPNSYLLFNTVTATLCKHSDCISGGTNYQYLRYPFQHNVFIAQELQRQPESSAFAPPDRMVSASFQLQLK